MTWRVDQADCLEWLAAMPAASCDLVFGSPPYENARWYLEGGKNLGIARNTEAWVAWMFQVVKASLRVCRGLVAFVVEGQTKNYRYSAGPLLLGADLVRAGIALRKPPIYHRSGIPGSGGPDWLRNDYEFIICATNGGKLPWSDNTACGHPPKWAPGGEISHRKTDGKRVNDPWGKRGRGNNLAGRRKDGTKLLGTNGDQPLAARRRITSGHKDGDTPNGDRYDPPAKANPGNVIRCLVGGGLLGSPLAHVNEAPFPEKLAELFVLSFCPPGGLALDPFSGSGTTGAVAVRNCRNFAGCDLRTSQVELSRRRISGETPLELLGEAT